MLSRLVGVSDGVGCVVAAGDCMVADAPAGPGCVVAACETGDCVAAAASVSTQWAKPVISPSGNWFRYSSHFDNKGIMEDADKPIKPILL